MLHHQKSLETQRFQGFCYFWYRCFFRRFGAIMVQLEKNQMLFAVALRSSRRKNFDAVQVFSAEKNSDDVRHDLHAFPLNGGIAVNILLHGEGDRAMTEDFGQRSDVSSSLYPLRGESMAQGVNTA